MIPRVYVNTRMLYLGVCRCPLVVDGTGPRKQLSRFSCGALVAVTRAATPSLLVGPRSDFPEIGEHDRHHIIHAVHGDN